MLAKHALSQLSYGPLVLRGARDQGFALASIAGGGVRLLGFAPSGAAPGRACHAFGMESIEPKPPRHAQYGGPGKT